MQMCGECKRHGIYTLPCLWMFVCIFLWVWHLCYTSHIPQDQLQHLWTCFWVFMKVGSNEKIVKQTIEFHIRSVKNR